jgi:hypothetical protein
LGKFQINSSLLSSSGKSIPSKRFAKITVAAGLSTNECLDSSISFASKTFVSFKLSS